MKKVIEGELHIDYERGVIYFYDKNYVPLLRIYDLKDIKEDAILIDIFKAEGVVYHANKI